MPTIVFGQFKGGTGKSTLAVNLACALSAQGQRVALLDANPQATAATWLERQDAVTVCHRPLCALRDLAAFHAATRDLPADHLTLVVDLPASIPLALAAALRTADQLVVPVGASPVDIAASLRVLAMTERINALRAAGWGAGRPPLTPLLVPNRVDRRTRFGQSIVTHLAALGPRVAPPLAQRAAHGQAFVERRWIGAHAPASPAHAETMAFVGALGLDAAADGAPTVEQDAALAA